MICVLKVFTLKNFLEVMQIRERKRENSLAWESPLVEKIGNFPMLNEIVLEKFPGHDPDLLRLAANLLLINFPPFFLDQMQKGENKSPV